MRIQLKKMLSILLALIFCFALVSATALADEPEEETHEYTVETVDELYAAVAEINANNYTATVTLTSDVTLLNSGSFAITFSAGNTTIVGGGHTIFMAPYRGIYVTNSAVVNLCLPDGTDSLILSNGDITNNLTNPIVYMDKNAEMNMYDGAVVCKSKSEGTPGGFQLSGNSVLNMYGGVIRDLFSGPIAGGVMLSNFAAFNMYGGVIENCINRAAGNVYWWRYDFAGGGGAVVISDSGKMTMNDGVIRNCRSEQTSGGAVFIMNPAAIGGSADTAKPSFIMNGGTITGCSAAQIAGAVGAFYYGEAEIYIGTKAVITGNRAGYFGGGVAIYDSPYEGTGGVLTIADGASIYNNVSDTAGDDVMLWRGTLHLGSVGTGLILEADGRTIDGWYDDGNNDDEEENPIRYSTDNIIPIGSGDYTSAIVMKAAHGPYAPMTVKKTFSGISASQIPEAFEMTVTSPGVAEPAATLKTTDEGVAVSEDGLTFTWTLEVPAGNYTVSENRANAEINNYSLTVSGDDGVEKEVGGEEAAVFEIINSYSYITPYYPPEPTPTPAPTPTPEPSRIPPDLEGGDHFAYIMGWPDGLVHPEDNITRAEVATIFFRLLKDEVREANLSETNDFSDVSEGMWFNRAVSTLANMGIVYGTNDGMFKPSENITRAEFAAITARFDRTARTPNTDFSDIEDHWAYLEISKAAENGWVNGYPDGTFRPDTYISRAEAMALINRVLERTPSSPEDLLDGMITWADNMDTTAWYYLDVQEATNSHDYKRPAGSSEKWTKLTELRDWTILEQ